jgi:hypothetical protein
LKDTGQAPEEGWSSVCGSAEGWTKSENTAWVSNQVAITHEKGDQEMKQMLVTIVAVGLVLGLVGPAWCDGDFVVYPAKGQSQEQTDKDKYECYNWAKGESNFDPMKTPTATAPPPPKEKQVGGAGRGAVGGGLLGAGVGALVGGKKGAGRGALVGAGSGALLGGVRRSDQKKREAQRQEQWERDQTSQYAAGRNAYNRAYAACMEGRGYSVK